MKLKIYDCCLNITNREGVQDCTEEKLEKLDEMLNEFGVSHCFSLTSTQEIKAIEEDDRDYCVTVMYKDGALLAKGNWFQDQILEYAAEKMLEADLDGACNKCKVTILR